MAIVGHSPNGTHETFLAHIDSAIVEWARTHTDELIELVRTALNLPEPEAIAEAAKASQDGSVRYVIDTGSGDVSVAPALPHTDTSAEAIEVAKGTPAEAVTRQVAAEGGDLSGSTPSAKPAETATATSSAAGSADVGPEGDPHAPPADDKLPPLDDLPS